MRLKNRPPKAVVYPGFLGWGGFFFTRELKNLDFCQTRKVSKFCKKSMQSLQLLKILKEICRFVKLFKKFIEIFVKI